MNLEEELKRLLNLHRHYYNINDNGEGSFCASATFHSHDSHYFLTKRLPIGEAESHEYVYFYITESLTDQKVKQLIEEAWERGLLHVKPSENHRNSDIILILLSENISEKAIKIIRNCNLFKSYNFLFCGWSAFKVLALETSTDKVITNKRGRDLKKLFK